MVLTDLPITDLCLHDWLNNLCGLLKGRCRLRRNIVTLDICICDLSLLCGCRVSHLRRYKSCRLPCIRCLRLCHGVRHGWGCTALLLGLVGHECVVHCLLLKTSIRDWCRRCLLCKGDGRRRICRGNSVGHSWRFETRELLLRGWCLLRYHVAWLLHACSLGWQIRGILRLHS